MQKERYLHDKKWRNVLRSPPEQRENWRRWMRHQQQRVQRNWRLPSILMEILNRWTTPSMHQSLQYHSKMKTPLQRKEKIAEKRGTENLRDRGKKWMASKRKRKCTTIHSHRHHQKESLQRRCVHGMEQRTSKKKAYYFETSVWYIF